MHAACSPSPEPGARGGRPRNRASLGTIAAKGGFERATQGFDPRGRLESFRELGQAPPVFTALIIAALIIAGAGAAVGGSMALASRKRHALPGSGGPKLLGDGGAGELVERGINEMRVHDIVMYDGRDFLIEGVILYDEAGHRWTMGRLVDGNDTFWLLVGLERTGGSSKRLLTPTTEVELNGYPPERVVVGDTSYSFDKRGTATTSLTGNTGSLAGTLASGGAHRCRWWNYQAAGGKALVIEQWGDDYRVLVGKKVADTEIELMPAS